jgi:quercetin dioxygenase-like cupin family protein
MTETLTNTPAGERITTVIDHQFSERELQVLRVDYGPGGATDWRHRHPDGAYVYVLHGAVELGLAGEPPVTVRAGETFFEPPGAVHSVSRNASDTEPASLLAIFVLAGGIEAAIPAD